MPEFKPLPPMGTVKESKPRMGRQTDREGNATEADVAAHAECERWCATYISPYNDLVANLPIANCQTFQSRAWATKPA